MAGDALVKLYEAQNAAEAQMLKDALDAEGIDSYVEQTPSPLDGLTSISEGTEVQVRSADADRAAQVLKRFDAERRQRP